MQSGRVPAVSAIPEPSPPAGSCRITASDRGFEIAPLHRQLTPVKTTINIVNYLISFVIIITIGTRQRNSTVITG